MPSEKIVIRPKLAIHPPRAAPYSSDVRSALQLALYEIAAAVDMGPQGRSAVIDLVVECSNFVDDMVKRWRWMNEEIRRFQPKLDYYESAATNDDGRGLSLRHFDVAQAAIARAGKRDRPIEARIEDLRKAKSILGDLPPKQARLLAELEARLAGPTEPHLDGAGGDETRSEDGEHGEHGGDEGDGGDGGSATDEEDEEA